MFLNILSKFVLIAILLIIIMFLFLLLLKYKYEKIVEEHSLSLKKLKVINEKYKFKKINGQAYNEYVDNENYFSTLSPKDLLVYNLILNKEFVKSEISSVIYNSNKYDLYKHDVKQISNLGLFNIEVKVLFKKMLLTLEKNRFNSLIKRPTIDYVITSTIFLTNINGRLKDWNRHSFYIDTIEDLLEKIENKTNERYNCKEVWDSICRIERAKVTNRLRFYIYDRDGYRCCKCGRSTEDLEIDHIIPISKGGKSHPENLQTLCKTCNKEKSNIIEARTFSYNSKICPKCGAPLRKINGRYGVFYGCINYPNCKYTER